MLNTNPNLRAGLVGLCLALAKRLAAPSLVMDVAAIALSLEFAFGLGRAVGAVAPEVRRGVVGIDQIIKALTVVHARIAHLIVADEFVPPVRIDMVLVAIMALAMLLRPSCRHEASMPAKPSLLSRSEEHTSELQSH